MRRRRALLIVVALVALLPVVLTVPVLAEPQSVTYSADANAAPIEVVWDVPEAAQTPVLDARVPHAQADISSPSQAVARATVLDPGALIETIPSLARQNGAPVPDYPYIAYAHYPDQPAPKEQTIGGQDAGPVSLAGGRFSAQAGASSASGTATSGALDLKSPANVSAAQSSAFARTTVSGNTVTSLTSSTLTNVDLFGVVHIGQLSAAATTTTVSGKPGTAAGSLTITGVSVSGTAASIDRDGLHLAGNSEPLAPGVSTAQQALDQLAQRGVTIKLLPESKVTTSGRGVYQGQAIQVNALSPDGTNIHLLLGSVSSSGFAAPELGFTLPELPGFVPPAQSFIPAPATGSTGAPGAPPAQTGVVPPTHVTRSNVITTGRAPRALLLALLGLIELAALTTLLLLVRVPRTSAGAETLAGL